MVRALVPAGQWPDGRPAVSGPTLPEVWARQWAARPDAPVLLDGWGGAPALDAGTLDGRVGRMPELANLAVLLLGPGAEYINGQTIAIDGAAHQAGGGGFTTLRGWSDEQWEAARSSIRGANETDRAKRTV